MLIAEDLLLLLLDDETGKLTNTTYLDTGIGGALLVELALGIPRRGVREDGPVGAGEGARHRARRPRTPCSPTRLRVVAAKERTAQDLVVRLGKGRRGNRSWTDWSTPVWYAARRSGCWA